VIRRVALLAFLALLAGCEREPEVEFDHFTLKAESVPPGKFEISADDVMVASGLAVLVKLAVYKDKEEQEPFEPVQLLSDRPDVLDAIPGPSAGTFVLVARSVGVASLSIEVEDGKFVGVIPAEVVTQ
jgi:hypothetical protein